MKPHTSDFKNAIKEMGRELRGVITYGNTTLEEEIMSITPHYEANILKSVMKQLDLELSVDIPLETVINCQIGILVGEEYEMLNFGNYVVYSSEKQEDTKTYRITCYDKMLYSMKQNEDLGVTYPITIKNYLTALANKIGLIVASGTFYNQDLQIPSELYVGLEYTYRDILDEIAQATGSIITLNNNDEIEVRYPNDLGSQTTVSGTNITISEHAGNKIVETIINGNTTQNSTTGKNLFNMDGNPIVDRLSSAGYTLKYNDDKTITINGTGTGAYKYLTWNLTLEAGTYIANGCPSGGSQNGYSFLINVGSSSYWDYGNGVSFTLTARTTIQLHPIRTGSDIPTFNNVTFKPMIRLSSITDASYEPYTGGIASPNPQYEQPINSAGDNINLFDKTANITRGYTYTPTGGTTQLNNCFVQEKYIEVESSKEYILSTTNSYISETNYRLIICEYDSSKNFIKRNLSSTQYYKITTSATTKYVRLCASTVTIDELKFEHGSIATPYSPYGMGSINEVISNKNLFKIPTTTINGITCTQLEDGAYCFNGTATANSFFKFALTKEIANGTNHVLSCTSNQTSSKVHIRTRNSSNGLADTMVMNVTSSSITSTKQCSYSEITIQNGAELSNFIVYPQLELGSSATSFVEHQEQNISIPCQQPMRSIGNVRDSFVKIDGVWYEKHVIGQVVLNGSESGWVERGNTSENYIKFRNANALPYDIKGDLLLISDYFVTNIGANNASYSGNAICGNSGNYAKWLHISIDNTIVNSVNAFKTWLSTHNTEVIYQLAEPIYLECTEEQITALEKISHTSLYSGDTHISSEGYLSITYFSTFETIDEEYLKDVNIDFSEVYGPVNSIVLSRAGESDNVYIQDETSVEQNGLCEIKIVDNQIMNFNDRDDYLPGLLSALDGLTYYKNDFNSTGILYYDVGDLYDVKIGENVYRCLMLNDEINVTTGIEERIYTDLPEQSQTDYSKADKTDRRINQTYLIIDKQNQIIESKVGKDEIISKINQTPEAITINANKLGISANDVLNILAGNTLNLTSKNISITSNNFSVDATGNATMNNANITGGEIYIDKMNGGTTPAITVDATSVQKSVKIYGDKIEVHNGVDPSKLYNMVIEGSGIYRNGNEYFVMKGLVKDYTPDNSFNQLQDSGFYYVGGNSVSNAPSGFTTWYMVLVVKISNTFIFQYAYSPSTGQIAIRTYSGGSPTWSEWKFINLL